MSYAAQNHSQFATLLLTFFFLLLQMDKKKHGLLLKRDLLAYLIILRQKIRLKKSLYKESGHFEDGTTFPTPHFCSR